MPAEVKFEKQRALSAAKEVHYTLHSLSATSVNTKVNVPCLSSLLFKKKNTLNVELTFRFEFDVLCAVHLDLIFLLLADYGRRGVVLC